MAVLRHRICLNEHVVNILLIVFHVFTAEHDVRDLGVIKDEYRHPKLLRFRNLAEITKEVRLSPAQAENQVSKSVNIL